MSNTYKITRVSSQPPREHYSQKYNSTTYYIKVMLEGHDRPVSIGKRAPDALKVGDTVYGTILPTAYDADNFKLEGNKPFAPSKDTGEIKAEWAIGQAVTLFMPQMTAQNRPYFGEIEEYAKELFLMVERVKNSTDTTVVASQTGYEKAKATAEAIKTKQPSPSDGLKAFMADDGVIDVTGDEEINLDDIPF